MGHLPNHRPAAAAKRLGRRGHPQTVPRAAKRITGHEGFFRTEHQVDARVLPRLSRPNRVRATACCTIAGEASSAAGRGKSRGLQKSATACCTIARFAAVGRPLGPSSAAHADWHCEVVALEVELSFWEKAAILESEYHRPADKPIPDRLSRHIRTWPGSGLRVSANRRAASRARFESQQCCG